jgi:hypothetical protein
MSLHELNSGTIGSWARFLIFSKKEYIGDSSECGHTGRSASQFGHIGRFWCSRAIFHEKMSKINDFICWPEMAKNEQFCQKYVLWIQEMCFDLYKAVIAYIHPFLICKNDIPQLRFFKKKCFFLNFDYLFINFIKHLSVCWLKIFKRLGLINDRVVAMLFKNKIQNTCQNFESIKTRLTKPTLPIPPYQTLPTTPSSRRLT